MPLIFTGVVVTPPPPPPPSGGGTVGTGWTILLDPVTLTSTIAGIARTQLDLNSGPIMVDQKGIDWGDAQIQTYMADRRVGSIKVDYRIPNRKVTIPLFLSTFANTSEEQARAQLQAKVGLLQRDGGWVGRQREGGEPMYADVVDAVLVLPDVWGETGDVEPNVELILECSPDFYGDEVTCDPMIASNGILTAVIKDAGVNAVIHGDHLARARLSVSEASGSQQNSLLWGVRARNYSSSASAGLHFEAETLTVINGAIEIGGGVSSGALVGSSPASSRWTAILGTDTAGGDFSMVHTGTYRVWARMSAGSTVPGATYPTYGIRVRLVWAEGAAINSVTNDTVLIPTLNSFYLVDLGEIRISAFPIGTPRWEGQIQAQSLQGSEGLLIDTLDFQPLDEAAGIVYRNTGGSALDAVDVVAFDFYNSQGDGSSLAGQASDSGAIWSFTSNNLIPLPSDLTIFDGSVGATNTVKRSGVTDPPWITPLGPYTLNGAPWPWIGGRIDLIGPKLGSCGISGWTAADLQLPLNSGCLTGLVVRFVDYYNFAALTMNLNSRNSGPWVQLFKVVRGAATILQSFQFLTWATSGPLDYPQLQSFGINVSSDGSYSGLVGANAYSPSVSFSGVDADFAPTGLLGLGRTGFWSFFFSGVNGGTVPITHYLGPINIQGAPSDAIMYPLASTELRYDAMLRAESTNRYYSNVANVIGDEFRIPPSGLEGRSVELFVRPSQGDYGTGTGTGPDPSLDSFTAQVSYRPCYLFRP